MGIIYQIIGLVLIAIGTYLFWHGGVIKQKKGDIKNIQQIESKIADTNSKIDASRNDILKKIKNIYNILDGIPHLSAPLIGETSYNQNMSNEEYNYYKQLAQDIKPIEENISKIDETTNFKANIYFYIGNLKATLNDYMEAVIEYKRAIALNSNNAFYFNNLGVVQNKLNNAEEAGENFQKAIKLAPNEAIYYRNLTRI